ncbi:MAG: hypothetical protein KBT20_05680 [Bacteroidales bacterium]|nr:hypothetical protein [Candidatus Liminaster caballi]
MTVKEIIENWDRMSPEEKLEASQWINETYSEFIVGGRYIGLLMPKKLRKEDGMWISAGDPKFIEAYVKSVDGDKVTFIVRTAARYRHWGKEERVVDATVQYGTAKAVITTDLADVRYEMFVEDVCHEDLEENQVFNVLRIYSRNHHVHEYWRDYSQNL